MASVGGRAETLTSVHSTLRESFQASDHAENHQIPRSLARVTLAAVLDGERSSTADRNVVRTLIDIIRAEEALANHPTPNQLANKRTWKSLKEMLRLRRNTSNPTCSLHSQNGSDTVVQFPQGQMLSQDSLGDLLGNGSIPASADVLPSDTDQRRRSIRLSDALAAERDETRSRGGVEAGDSAGGDVNVGGGDQSVQEEPIRMSLMDLLEETERQARLQGPPVYRFDDDEERGEDGDDKMEVEQEEKGGGAGVGEVSCCVCMVRHKGAAFIPCGHTFCRMCSRELWVQRGHCPLCNNFILEVLDIF